MLSAHLLSFAREVFEWQPQFSIPDICALSCIRATTIMPAQLQALTKALRCMRTTYAKAQYCQLQTKGTAKHAEQLAQSLTTCQP